MSPPIESIFQLLSPWKWFKKYRPIKIKDYQLFKHQEIKYFFLLKEQGYCNTNYLLETNKKRYLVRKFKHQNNRKAELYIQKLAHKKGIAGEPLLLDEKNNLMICTFVEGKHLYKLNQHKLKKLALILKKLHKIKLQQKPNSLKNNFKLKNKKVQQAYLTLEKYKPEYVLGHNDLHPKNILFGKKIQLIDWEYAGVTDRYLDLVSIILEYKLNKKDEKTFLRSYFGHRVTINYKKLEAYKIIHKTLWKLWFGELERGEIRTVSKNNDYKK